MKHTYKDEVDSQEKQCRLYSMLVNMNDFEKNPDPSKLSLIDWIPIIMLIVSILSKEQFKLLQKQGRSIRLTLVLFIFVVK